MEGVAEDSRIHAMFKWKGKYWRWRSRNGEGRGQTDVGEGWWGMRINQGCFEKATGKHFTSQAN